MSRMTSTRMVTNGRRGMRQLAGLGTVDPTDLTPAQREVWFKSLPSAAQTTFINQTQALFRSLPMPLQQALTRYMISIGEKVPFASGVAGYGPVSGLGQWAELATAVMNIGGSLYNKREDGKLAELMQSNALNSDANIIAARNSAAIQAAQIMADAQKATAAQLAQSNRAAAQQSHDATAASTSSVKTIVVVCGAVAALGVLAYAILKKK